jgi:hypothetical protein
MHNHGTALLDRPEAAPDLTPPLEYAWHRPADAPDVHDLSRTELTVAVYASDAPLRSWRDLDSMRREELLAWAAQGLDRLGEELTWWYAWRTRALGGHEDTWTADDRAEWKRMWPKARRESLANDAAWHIAPIGTPWPGEGRWIRITVPLPGFPGHTVKTVVVQRDLDFARRYPERAATDAVLSHAAGIAYQGRRCA